MSWEGCAGGTAGAEGLSEEEVRAALEHPLYDVRAATLKAMLAQCKGTRARDITAKRASARSSGTNQSS